MTACIVGWAHTPFGKLNGESVESLIVRVAGEALADAGVSPKDVDEIVLGHFNAGFSQQDFTAALVLQASPDLLFKRSTRVENACATGSADPVAQAFSTRVARLKRRSGEACNTSAAVKSCCEKPALKCPSTISSTSLGETPASASASPATRTIRLSTLSPLSLPKGVWAQPTIAAVIEVSFAELWSH